MNFFLLSTLVILVLSGPAIVHDPSAPLFTQNDIDVINQSQDSWTASLDWVGSMSFEQAKKYAFTQISTRQFSEYNWGALLENFQAPNSFDSRTQWPKCVQPIQDQLKCSSGWAFGATGALSDRFCISSNAKISVALSPQYLINCDAAGSGCNGGSADLAWKYLMSNGAPTNSCVQYEGSAGECLNICNNWDNLQFYKATNVAAYSNPASIQAAIMAGGPIEASFEVYEDFLVYKGGIYKHTTGKLVGGQSVKIVGWGNQNGTSYWICANSWGTVWGIKGYFNIAFGQCSIDSQGVAGSPLI